MWQLMWIVMKCDYKFEVWNLVIIVLTNLFVKEDQRKWDGEWETGLVPGRGSDVEIHWLVTS
jgi:hypothetical protein